MITKQKIGKGLVYAMTAVAPVLGGCEYDSNVYLYTHQGWGEVSRKIVDDSAVGKHIEDRVDSEFVAEKCAELIGSSIRPEAEREKAVKDIVAGEICKDFSQGNLGFDKTSDGDTTNYTLHLGKDSIGTLRYCYSNSEIVDVEVGKNFASRYDVVIDANKLNEDEREIVDDCVGDVADSLKEKGKKLLDEVKNKFKKWTE